MSAGTTMERVYLELKARIVAAELPPGTRLGPAELAKLLDASPTPVRDALYRLSGERVVESWHLEGFRMPLVTERDLQHLYGWSGTLLALALRGRSEPPSPAGHLFELPVCPAYPEATESLFRAIASGCENREIRFAITNVIERTQIFRAVEARFDTGAREALAAMEEDFRFGRWTSLRSKITSFHRRRASQADRIVAELRPRSDALG
jgi:hypothetical protein